MTSDRQPWLRKFAVAFRGLARSLREQQSFWVHIPFAIAALALAAWLRVEPWCWGLLVIVICVVLSAELMNTALEQLVRVIHPERDERIGHALDAAAAAVLILASGAVVVGLITLGIPLWNAIAAQ